MNRKMRFAMLAGACFLVFAGMTVLAVEHSNQSAVGTWQLDVTKSSNGKIAGSNL